MESTTNRTDKQPKEQRKTSLLRRVFGGEFLLSKQMRPWYLYFAFVLLLACILIIGEQSFSDKKMRIIQLENEYKAELSKLKANNQFIPYEENQLLIQKMQERGYQLNEEHTYTIFIKKPVEEKRRFLFFKKRNPKTESAKDTLPDPAISNEQDEKQETKQ